MKRKILLKGPVLTQSGYGEQTRFAMRSIKSREDLFDIYILPTMWGHTGWSREQNEEKDWIDATINKTIEYINAGNPVFDYCVQSLIPNEFERIAKVNIGYTAGVETTKVHHTWITNPNENVNKIITTSTHTKNTLVNTVYQGTDERTQQQVTVKMQIPVTPVNYCVKEYENVPNLDLELKHDFNFLCVAQWGPRKNIENTIKWFIEEFKDDDVGLIVKTNLSKNCLMDREHTQDQVRAAVGQHEDLKCSIYLLHGDMHDNEMIGLYKHDKIKAFVSLTHGEGFGLPIFEAAYSGLPVIATAWSGQLDFLTDEEGNNNFYPVSFDLAQVPKEVVWENIILEDSMWSNPREFSAKKQMRKVYETIKNPDEWPDLILAPNLCERFSPEKMHKKFVDEILEFEELLEPLQNSDWMSDISSIVQEYE